MVGERNKGALVSPPYSRKGLSAKFLIEGRESWIEPFQLESIQPVERVVS
jgi:hypothetical protein